MQAVQIALVMFVIAFTVILAGALLMILSALGGRAREGERKVEGGAVVIVGPVPIVFGTSERITKALIILAIALLLVSAAVFLLLSGVLWG